jgi:hypothetical protein
MSAYPIRVAATHRSATVHAARRVPGLLFHLEAACGRLIKNATSDERAADTSCRSCRARLDALDTQEAGECRCGSCEQCLVRWANDPQGGGLL